MGGWVQAIVVIVVQCLGVAFVYGATVQKQKEHERRLGELDAEQDQQWDDIGILRENMGKVKGKLGLNGA